MKKTRAKKEVSNSKQVSFFKKYFPALLIVGVLLLAIILLNVSNSTGNVITGEATSSVNVLEGSVPDWGESVLSFFNVGVSEGMGIGNTWKDLIIAVIVFVIILAGMYNILTLTSIFDEAWVIWVMAAGLAIIASLTGLIRGITVFLIQVAAGLGAFGIVIEIIISIGVFIALSFGSSAVAKWAAQRKANKDLVKGIKGMGKVRAGVKTAKALGEEAAKGE